MGQAGGRPPAARRGGPRPLRGGRPLLPVALRAPLQLRADVGPSRRLDLLGPLRRGDPLRRDGLRAREARPRGGRHRLLRGRSQGDGPLLDVGASRRARPRRQPVSAARRPGPSPAPRGPARLPPQPDHRDASLPQPRREGPRRAPDPGDAVRQALDRRLRRRRRELDRPRPRRARVLRGEGPPRPRGRGRGRPHPGPGGRGARRRRHRLSRQPRRPRGLEPGLDRLQPRLPGRRHARRLRAVDAGGAVLPARLERHRGAGRARLPAGDRGAAHGRVDGHRPADRGRLPHGEGLGLRDRGPRLSRRRPQAVLRRLLPGARRALGPHLLLAPQLRGLGPPLRDGPGRPDRPGAVLLRRAPAPAQGGRGRPRHGAGHGGAARRGAETARRLRPEGPGRRPARRGRVRAGRGRARHPRPSWR